MNIETWPLERIIPYASNPRKPGQGVPDRRQPDERRGEVGPSEQEHSTEGAIWGVNTRADISCMRSRSMFHLVAGYIAGLTFAAVFITAFIQASIVTYASYRGRDRAMPAWLFFSNHLGPLWSFAWWLPFPKNLTPEASGFSPWIWPMVFYMCLVLCAAGLLHRGRKLRDAANEAEKELRSQAPILMSLSAMAAATSQTAKVGNVSGAGNTVNATNTINHTIHEGEKKSLLDKFWIPLAIAAGTVLFNKLAGTK